MPANPKSSVTVNRNGDKFAYVKVAMRSWKRWGWSLYRDGNDIALEQSEELFRCAEDAWKAGQIALLQYTPVQRAA